jgi:hypothetical protein
LQFPYLNLLHFQSQHVRSYVTNPFYVHFTTILLAFIPPFSFLLIWWIVLSRKKLTIMFWATLTFLLVHWLIPQKQERFLLPILPEIIVLGLVGAGESVLQGKKWVVWFWRWLWSVNFIIRMKNIDDFCVVKKGHLFERPLKLLEIL